MSAGRIETAKTEESEELKSSQQRPEISEKSRTERDFLAGMLIQQTEELAEVKRRRKEQKGKELIELIDGRTFTIDELKRYVTPDPQPYQPRFPNEVPFFKEIFRLLGLEGDPNNYIKPKIVGVWLTEIIYGRFNREVLSALRVLNPFGGVSRRYKLFQHLNPEAQQLLIQFRDEALDLMKKHTDPYEFRKEMHEKYGVPYQVRLFNP